MRMEGMKFVADKIGFVCLLAAFFCAMTAEAQPPNAFTTIWTNPATSNWTTTSNWSGGTVPDVTVEDAGVINNGGIAFVNSIVPQQTGGVVLGARRGRHRLA